MCADRAKVAECMTDLGSRLSTEPTATTVPDCGTACRKQPLRARRTAGSGSSRSRSLGHIYHRRACSASPHSRARQLSARAWRGDGFLRPAIKGPNSPIALAFVPRESDVADAALDTLHTGDGVHQAHCLGDHTLVAQRTLEHDLPGRDFRLHSKCRSRAAEPAVKCRMHLR